MSKVLNKIGKKKMNCGKKKVEKKAKQAQA